MKFTQFRTIIELVNTFNTEQKCIDYLTEQRWAGLVVSPFDPASKVYVCKYNKYKCKNTGKYFNVRTGSIFDDTKVPLQKWFMAIYIVASHKKGISSHQLGRDLNITQKSAWFMLHRIRYAFGNDNFTTQLGNIVECDETYVGGKTRNKHEWERKERAKKGTGYSNMTPVFGMLERGGLVIAGKVNEATGETLKPIIKNYLKPDATLITDGFGAYSGLNKHFEHIVVNHQQGVYSVGNAHTNTIEGFWSLFKRGVVGIYHFVSPKHLDSYLDEFSYRYNTRKISQSERFGLLLTHTNVRLKYADLINR